MMNHFKKFHHLICLGLFLSTVLFINFFHTEETLCTDDDCPACNFLSSAVATGQIDFFHLPQLSLLETVQIFYKIEFKQVFLIHPISRSPPEM
jgi:hypothetical protein